MTDMEFTIDEIDSISYSRNGLNPITKSPTIWGNKGNTTWPLCYLRKPRSMSEVEWQKFLDRFTFELKTPDEKKEKRILVLYHMRSAHESTGFAYPKTYKTEDEMVRAVNLHHNKITTIKAGDRGFFKFGIPEYKLGVLIKDVMALPGRCGWWEIDGSLGEIPPSHQ